MSYRWNHLCFLKYDIVDSFCSSTICLTIAIKVCLSNVHKLLLIIPMNTPILPCADKTLYLSLWKLFRRAILVTSLIPLHTLVIYRV